MQNKARSWERGKSRLKRGNSSMKRRSGGCQEPKRSVGEEVSRTPRREGDLKEKAPFLPDRERAGLMNYFISGHLTSP